MREKLFTIRMTPAERERAERVARHYGLNVAGVIRFLFKREDDQIQREARENAMAKNLVGAKDSFGAFLGGDESLIAEDDNVPEGTFERLKKAYLASVDPMTLQARGEPDRDYSTHDRAGLFILRSAGGGIELARYRLRDGSIVRVVPKKKPR
jgi:hypothetical protein